VISGFIALTLTPALCALILKEGTRKLKPIQMFDRFFERVTGGYVGGVGYIVRRAWRFMILYALIIGGVVLLFKTIPGGFVPEEDQGYLMVLVQAPQGASLDYTMGIVKQVEQVMLKLPESQQMFAAGGFSFTGSAPNQGILFTQLKDFKERRGPEVWYLLNFALWWKEYIA